MKYDLVFEGGDAKGTLFVGACLAGADAIAMYFDTPSSLVLPSRSKGKEMVVQTTADRIATDLLEQY